MHISNGTLVLVADGSKMFLLRNDGDKKLAVFSTLSADERSSPPSGQQGSDAPGRTFASMGHRRSSYSETDWHRQDEERFAVAACDRLREAAAVSGSDIVVIAPPKTLGILRKHYGAAMEPRVIAEIAKDLTRHVTDDIGAAIAAHGP